MPKSFGLVSRLALAFSALLLLFAGLQVILTIWTWDQSLDRAEQVLNWKTAEFLAQKLELAHQKSRKLHDLENIVLDFQRANPKATVYILNPLGQIEQLFFSDQPDSGQKQVNLQPIKKFLLGSPLTLAPLRGDNPADRRRPTIFSVASMTLLGKPFYLYIIFTNDGWRNTAVVDYQNAIMSMVGFWTILSLISISLVAVFLFRMLTRRLSRITETVKSFRSGDFTSRIGLESVDELGALANTIDDMAAQIQNSIAMLEGRDALRRELIANVSHDLRGPLANIQGKVEFLKRHSLPTKEILEEFFATMKRNLSSLSDLLGQLFELAKLEAQEQRAELEEFPIDQLLSDILVGYKTRASEAGVDLAFQPQAELLRVIGDIRLLDRVLVNLLENALKFTPAGGRIELRANEEGSKVRVSIADTGSGISAEELPKVFEKFYQAETGKKHKGSAGLGLAIVERLLHLHGSSVEVESEENQGTKFSFLLSRANT